MFSYPTVFVGAVVCPCSSLSFFLKVHKRIVCITLLLGLSNDEDKNVKVKFTQLHRPLLVKPLYSEDAPANHEHFNFFHAFS